MVEILYHEDARYNGVFKYLQRVYKKENIYKSGKINITGSDSLHGSVAESKGIEWPLITKDDKDTFWKTKLGDEKWYQIDFKNNLFVLKGYEYKAFHGDFFAEWYLNGSLDGVNYEIIHHITDFKEPDEDFLCKYFEISETLKPYRYFKFIPVGKSVSLCNYLSIHRIEFYGTFYDTFKKRCSFNRRVSLISPSIVFYICLMRS